MIIATWNGRRHLEVCLPSLAQTTYENVVTILVDNGSTDGSAARAKELLPSAIVLTNPRNRGFAAANNQGIQVALQRGGNYVMLLNDDTKLLTADWLAAAVSIAEQDCGIGMIGFELRDDPTAPALTDEMPAPQHVEHIPGCALFIRANVLRDIGVLDEAYFNYFEEDDLEARAVRAGYRMVRINRAIYHRSEGTSSRVRVRSQYLAMRNAIRYSMKNQSLTRTLMRCARLLDVCCNPFPVTIRSDDTSHRRLRGNGNLLRNAVLYYAALVWNFIMLPATLVARYKAARQIVIAREHRR